MSRLSVRQLKSLASKAEVEIESIRIGKKHYVVFVKRGWKKGIVTVSWTPSDENRVFKNIVSDMRRVVR